MHRLPTLRFTRLGRVVVLVHRTQAPSDEDWEAYVDGVWSLDQHHAETRTLVLTDGAGPNALQRGVLIDRVESSGSGLSAIVSGSKKARLILTAISWFVADLKFFRPDELSSAFAFLELEADEKENTLDAALELLDDGWAPQWERRLRGLRG